MKEAFRQLELYLAGKLKKFDLPLKAEGTPFMKRVWEKLVEVPYGKTASYKDLAIASGNPKAVRAVGMANAGIPSPSSFPATGSSERTKTRGIRRRAGAEDLAPRDGSGPFHGGVPRPVNRRRP